MSSQTIRQQLRQQRGLLSTRQQSEAALFLAYNLTKMPLFCYSSHIAFYLANDGEIDPLPAIEEAHALGKKCYLPVLHPLKFNRLYFARYKPGQTLRPNRFGIPEPVLKSTQLIPAWALSLILLPLVAFDKQGNRMGMGGGFYDRTLAFTRQNKSYCPKLIGLAHSFQQLDRLQTENWDIPLHCIVTDADIITTHGT